jgi:hypothetical protein
MSSSNLGGMEALLSTVQMPSGIPVATVAIGGAVNAALLAMEMLAISDDALAAKLAAKRAADTEAVLAKNAAVEAEFKALYSDVKKMKKENKEAAEKVKEENYAVKAQIVEELKALLEKTEDMNVTFPAFKELQNRWKAAGQVPQAKAKDLLDTYQHYVEKFYDYIKISNEFRDMDFKKNLEAKSSLCGKAEALAQHENVVEAFKELQKLHEEWKETGPVAKEFRDQIWERFKNATSAINKRHQQHYEQLKESQKKNLAAKELLCEKAEEIAVTLPDSSNGWNDLSKRMDQLQEEWKKIGFASKKDNQKIYDRFRAACDKFYAEKRVYYTDFKNVMQDNLSLKEELCAKAEALMESENWKEATDQLIALQKQWKQVGPVVRKQSDVVWKRFRAACDHFFDRKMRHEQEELHQFEDNLKQKEELVAEIRAYRIKNDRAEDIRAMREFQNRWNAIGFVPFREKERIQKEFNEAMDAHFADIRSLEGEKKLNKFRRMVMEVKNSGKGTRGLKFEREKLLLKYRKMEQDIATLENNMGFFAKSRNADSMINDLEKKIAVAREELARIEEKINIIDSQFE